MSRIMNGAVLCGALLLGGCVVTPPVGPSIASLPSRGKSLDVFQQEDAGCRQYASQAIGNISPSTASNQSAFASTALGTFIGGAMGAAIGAAAGDPAAGAAIGASSGLLFGAASGAGAAQYSGATMQQRYDVSYAQCMVSKGNALASPYNVAAPYPSQGYYYGGRYASPAYYYRPGYYPAW